MPGSGFGGRVSANFSWIRLGCKKKGWSRRFSHVSPILLGGWGVAFTEMEKIEEDRVWVKSRVSFGNVKFEVPL